MKSHTVVTIRCRVKVGMQQAFKNRLKSFFNILSKDPDFITGILHENEYKPDEIFIYELWDGNSENFQFSQIAKPYMDTLAELSNTFLIEKELNVHTVFAHWENNIIK